MTVRAGVAPKGALLAFSVGTELTILAVTLTAGLTCTGLILRGVRLREAIAIGRAEQPRPPRGMALARRDDDGSH